MRLGGMLAGRMELELQILLRDRSNRGWAGGPAPPCSRDNHDGLAIPASVARPPDRRCSARSEFAPGSNPPAPALDSFTPMNNTYYFWSGSSSKDGVARTYMGRLSRVFKLAGIPSGHAHRFRDTFATELSPAGVPLERVSVLLGHTNLKVTQKHYSPCLGVTPEALGSC